MTVPNMLFQNKSLMSNPVLIPHESVRIRNQNNNRNNIGSYKSGRSSTCATEKYLQNYISQQRVAPTIASCAKATKSKREKVCITGDSHLKQIDKRQFRKVLAKCSATLNFLLVRMSNN